MQIIGADPEGSVYSGGTGRPYLVEGVGEDFWPDDLRPVARRPRDPVSDAESFLTARRVTREEGILIGGSGGTAVAAALASPTSSSPDDVVVVLLPDSGRGYLSKVFNDEWMADFGFLARCDLCVGDVLDARGERCRRLVYVNPSDTVRDAIDADAQARRVAAAGVQERAAARGGGGVRVPSTSSS